MGIRQQLQALFPVLTFGTLLLVVTTALVWLPMRQRVAADPSAIVRGLLGALLFRIEIWLGPLLLLCGGVAAIVALVQARRRATSMALLQECVAKLAVGDADPISFKTGDEFKKFEAPLSGVGKRIEQLTRGNLEMLRVLRHNLEGVAQRASGPANAEVRESVAVLIRDVDTEIRKLQLK